MTAQLETNMTLLSQTALAPSADALGIAVWTGYAYVAHPFTGGFSVLDVADPRAPRQVALVPAPVGTTSLHVQATEGLLLVGQEAHDDTVRALAGRGIHVPRPGLAADPDLPFSAGVAVYDLADPVRPRAVGRLDLDGFGVHRVWWDGGRYATVSMWPPGFADFILGVVDLADPVRPQLVGSWHPEELEPGDQGDEPVAGEAVGEAAEVRVGLHHAVLCGDLVYGGWRDGGLHVCDISDPSSPRRVGGLDPSAWGGGMTHSTLPLPGRGLVVLADEAMQDHCRDGERRVWLLDAHDLAEPRVVEVFPQPADRRYCEIGGRFAPHNLYENHRGGWQSETVVFATYENAGVRAYDITDPFDPREVGAVVPAAPAALADPRSNGALVVQSADIHVSAEGLVYFSDLSAGVSIAEFSGP